ncbi:MAG: hypothetical protein HQM16_13350 [Deltaproteobacteria bacterium]|nr:hypothetical protein [Deltaproteobacteria bacterium]
MDDSQRQDFYRLREDRLNFTTDGEWDNYYSRMAPYLSHPEAAIRHIALERLSTAVMRIEKLFLRSGEPCTVFSTDHAGKRLTWLLTLVEKAHAAFGDMIPAFLNELRHLGDDEPFAILLCQWLRGFLNKVPDGVSVDEIRGTLILHGDCGSTWEEAAPRLLKLLDDPSDYVRGCAANILGESCDSHTNPSAKELCALIQAKEIARPGIAGPFWSSLQYNHTDTPDVVDWMLKILEERQGEEPAKMPFNGIDFYLHELCDGSLDAIERMLKSGHKWLALATATETQGVVDGMKEILLRLGEDPDPMFAREAWGHLARYYRTLHPRINDQTVVRTLPGWDIRAEVFMIRQGDSNAWRDVLVIYPKETPSSLDSKTAWELIDLALPISERGSLIKGSPEIDLQTVSHSTNNKLYYEFAAGPLVTIERAPDKGVWNRIDIIGRGIKGDWG